MPLLQVRACPEDIYRKSTQSPWSVRIAAGRILYPMKKAIQLTEDGISMVEDFTSGCELWKEALGEGIKIDAIARECSCHSRFWIDI